MTLFGGGGDVLRHFCAWFLPRECINFYDAKQQREKRENEALSYSSSSSEVVAGATGEEELGRGPAECLMRLGTRKRRRGLCSDFPPLFFTPQRSVSARRPGGRERKTGTEGRNSNTAYHFPLFPQTGRFIQHSQGFLKSVSRRAQLPPYFGWNISRVQSKGLPQKGQP